ncbi:hypothetical protein FIU86_16040 [Roseovarius sp. THAF9]|nr:hypothetical protein FIU86_16040 [Roseovarius sp. THAF9]
MKYPRLSKWAWFIGLWAASVLSLGIIAAVIRTVLL